MLDFLKRKPAKQLKPSDVVEIASQKILKRIERQGDEALHVDIQVIIIETILGHDMAITQLRKPND